MPPSKVIRIDEQVWAELQKLATPLEDTPNSVLRRVFGLPAEGDGNAPLDSRIAKLLDLVQELVGQEPQVHSVRKNYSFLSRTEQVVAYIRPQQQKLRIGVSKETADRAGLQGWDRERKDGFFGGPSLRWYIEDGDEAAFQRAAHLLEQVWKSDFEAASREPDLSPDVVRKEGA